MVFVDVVQQFGIGTGSNPVILISTIQQAVNPTGGLPESLKVLKEVIPLGQVIGTDLPRPVIDFIKLEAMDPVQLINLPNLRELIGML